MLPSKETSTEMNTESSNTQTNANEANNSNSSELLKRQPIGNSPLCITGNEEQGYAVTLGQYKITEIYPTQEDVEEQLRGTAKWNTLCRLMTTITEIALAHEKTEMENELKLKLDIKDAGEEYQKRWP